MIGLGRIIFIMAIFVMLFGISSLAQEVIDEASEVSEFQDVFGMDSDDFTDEVGSGSHSDEFERCSDFGAFSFTSGLNHLRFSSFTKDKYYVGYGEEGATVGMIVYTMDEDAIKVIDSSIKTLGASGLYSQEISYKPMTTQYLVVAVMCEGRVVSRTYEVTIKEEATKSLLENLSIDFWHPTNQLDNGGIPAVKFTMPEVAEIEL